VKKINGQKIEITNADKELFPDDGITKGEVVDYYERIAENMLPYMKNRPLALQRYPDGIEEEGFYQKEAAEYFPDYVERVRIKLENGSKQDEIVCNNAATLVYLANLGAITPHIWLSTTDAITIPDKIVFDLDPSDDDPSSPLSGSLGTSFSVVKEGARDLRKTLDSLGLTCFVMTTGSHGLHVVAPLRPEHEFSTVKEFAKAVAQNLETDDPKFTTKVRKEKRRGRVFVDYLRNEYAQTSVAPYALRALPGAPVATPLDWDELSDSKLNAQSYTMENIFKRLSRREDPWKDFVRHRASLPQLTEITEPQAAK
jgi:bifunctional non-homologous end joining protein LigD